VGIIPSISSTSLTQRRSTPTRARQHLSCRSPATSVSPSTSRTGYQCSTSIRAVAQRPASQAAATPPRRLLRHSSIHQSTARGAHAVGDDDPAAAGGAASAGPYAWEACARTARLRTTTRARRRASRSARHAALMGASRRTRFPAALSSSSRRRTHVPVTRGKTSSSCCSSRLSVHPAITRASD
jgi:hypothetical protein